VTDPPASPDASLLRDQRDLLDGIRVGDDEALTAFDRLFRTRLIGAACRRGMDRQTAEDVVQETLLAAIVQIADGRFEERASLGAWVWAIFLRRFADMARQDARRAARFTELGPGEPSTASSLIPMRQPDAGLEESHLRERVRLTLQELSPRERMVLLLKVQRKLPAREIARILKLGTKTTEAALTAAKKRFAGLWGVAVRKETERND
jgi:RNA polymerase sigma-70 factor (ECF subfamily)